ncbi:integrase, catalytic region, zinc finger, CCHC-type containing protein [Tanacetum coccineum]|uniref:Integrase, catalytic region, zinc finger, CCHC-type containing protein n=1 Tax=Tanacetum coccineum TaxID=301880 RepID=A0ABQ5I910_9ASTR
MAYDFSWKSSQKTYAYSDVRFKNQDLLIIISELKEKLKTFENGESVNTKFDKSVTSEKLVCVTPLPNNIAVQAKKVSKSEDTTDRTPSSVRIHSNKRKTMNSNEFQSNASVLNTMTVNAVNDRSNLVCVSCDKDVFLLCHEKCVAHYALSKDSRVIQLIFWIVDSGCSKHMTGNLQLLRNFIKKFIGIVHFENDPFAAITRYGDYVHGNLMICHIYYVEGLRHNYFSEGDDFLTGSCESNLYTISISELAASSPVCLMSKATSTTSWLWHQWHSHLNFYTINQLTSNDLVDGLPKFKYDKDHLCSACFLSINIGSEYRIQT